MCHCEVGAKGPVSFASVISLFFLCVSDGGNKKALDCLAWFEYKRGSLGFFVSAVFCLFCLLLLETFPFVIYIIHDPIFTMPGKK